MERNGPTQVLGGDFIPERNAPPRRSSKDADLARIAPRNAPLRTSSHSRKRNKQNSKKKNQAPVAENVRIENGQIMWEAPKLRTTTRGSLLHRQQSIRNSKCVSAMSANANAIEKMMATEYVSDDEKA